MDSARTSNGSMPALMGIVNLTPDSFSDGGRWLEPARAVAQARNLAAAGAAWLDLGAESTRPGAEAVPAEIQWQRLAPVLEALTEDPPTAMISIDTRSGVVARRALAAGARMVNDVAAGADPELLAAVAAAGADLVLMHMRGDPTTMQDAPIYGDVVDEVIAFLVARCQAARAQGIADAHLIVDPGIGFGKRPEHNLALLRALPRLQRELGTRLLLGISRKSLLAAVLGRPLPIAERDGPSHVLHALLARHCDLLRVHDVAGARDALALAAALDGGQAA